MKGVFLFVIFSHPIKTPNNTANQNTHHSYSLLLNSLFSSLDVANEVNKLGLLPRQSNHLHVEDDLRSGGYPRLPGARGPPFIPECQVGWYGKNPTITDAHLREDELDTSVGVQGAIRRSLEWVDISCLSNHFVPSSVLTHLISPPLPMRV